jgi:hypothetical protein
MKSRRRLWNGTHKHKGNEEGQEEADREPWPLGRHEEKLNNSARTV